MVPKNIAFGRTDVGKQNIIHIAEVRVGVQKL